MKPLDIKNADIYEILWTKIKLLYQNDTINNLQELHHNSQTKNELPTIPPQSSFQPGPDTQNKQSIVQEDTQVPQEAQDQLSTVLQDRFDLIALKSPTDVGRSNLLEMDIPTTRAPIAHKFYPIPLKYQKFIDNKM